MTPPWAKKQWHEIRFVRKGYQGSELLDRRRRSKTTAEKLADEMRATGKYSSVWLVEVNRL